MTCGSGKCAADRFAALAAEDRKVNPGAKIIVVSHAQGVDFLMKGAKDRNGNKYEDLVEQLKQRGVRFDVCEITLRNRKLTNDQFIADVTGLSSST